MPEPPFKPVSPVCSLPGSQCLWVPLQSWPRHPPGEKTTKPQPHLLPGVPLLPPALCSETAVLRVWSPGRQHPPHRAVCCNKNADFQLYRRRGTLEVGPRNLGLNQAHPPRDSDACEGVRTLFWNTDSFKTAAKQRLGACAPEARGVATGSADTPGAGLEAITWAWN